MKCIKCKKEIEEECKFCSNCGEKIEEKSSLTQLEDMTKTCAKCWYLIGFIRGITSNSKKDKKVLEEFERLLKENADEMWEWYQEIVSYWKEQAKQNNEKNKKTNGSKRISISEAKRIKI